ncbi:MAG: hypothetical protein A3B68_02025 [Candidatus Melainabacteria bacterium RIFCSPHIGHO2_02_FULL_34_12]|nr:MAG: hypothetical protein A3B68_02025 [Candidatus Melainabacteria bacterium RIFCSPHIGHO2_02_FULL_34_12]
MPEKTEEKIIKYLRAKGQVSGKELFDHFEISDRAIRKQLKKLFEKELIYKVGRPPKVFYSIKESNKEEESKAIIEKGNEEIINEKFLIITPSGEEKEGIEGFKYWCKKFNLPVEKTAKEYIQTLKKYDLYKKDRLIDGLAKFKSTFEQVYLDQVYYIDFYSIERFGKTKLGQFLLYAKQSQNKAYIKNLITYIKPQIEHAIKKFKIDGIGFVPPTVKREIQIMKELEKAIKPNHRLISITKIKTTITVPQKTLSKLNDRIENAKNTFVVNENGTFKNILLVDDAVGSGATLNEIAKKIRARKICKGKIIGLAIVGSFKGFDVISEV